MILGDSVGARRHHHRLDRPGLFLAEDDHEGDLAVRCDPLIGDIGPLGRGKLPLDLGLRKGVELRIGQEIAAVDDLLPENNVIGIGDDQTDPDIRQRVRMTGSRQLPRSRGGSPTRRFVTER